MATALKISARIVRGAHRFCIDLRAIGKGREYFNDRFDAETRLLAIQNQGLAAAALSPAERHEFIEAKGALQSLGAGVREAVEFFQRHHHAREEKSLQEAAAAFIASKKERNRRWKYTDALRYDLNALAEFCNGAACHEITPEKIEQWLRAANWKPKTKNGKLINLGTFFGFCLRRGWVLEDPCAKVERFAADRKPPGILTPKQAKALMVAARSAEPKMLPYLTLCLFSGIRPEEVFRLSWAKVDLRQGIVRIDADISKTHRTRIVHLSENARAWLKLGGDLPPGANQWQDALNRIRCAAGFVYSVRTKRRGVKSQRFPGMPWPHDCLRHSFVSYSIPIHGISETAREAGHSESILHENYKVPVPKSEARKFWEIWP